MKTPQPTKETYRRAMTLAVRFLLNHERAESLCASLRTSIDNYPPTDYELLLADTIERVARFTPREHPAEPAVPVNDEQAQAWDDQHDSILQCVYCGWRSDRE